MKVIAPGREQNGWAREYECTGKGNGDGGCGCGAGLLVEEDDMYFTFSSHYDGSNERYNTFKCCQCGVETDVSSVPGHVLAKMELSRSARIAARKRRKNAISSE